MFIFFLVMIFEMLRLQKCPMLYNLKFQLLLKTLHLKIRILILRGLKLQINYWHLCIVGLDLHKKKYKYVYNLNIIKVWVH